MFARSARSRSRIRSPCPVPAVLGWSLRYSGDMVFTPAYASSYFASHSLRSVTVIVAVLRFAYVHAWLSCFGLRPHQPPHVLGWPLASRRRRVSAYPLAPLTLGGQPSWLPWALAPLRASTRQSPAGTSSGQTWILPAPPGVLKRLQPSTAGTCYSPLRSL